MDARRFLVVLALVITISACVPVRGPTRTQEDYELKASGTAAAVLSALGTARLVVDGVADGDLFASYTTVMLSESEDAASGAQASFESLQPPPGHRAATLRS